MCLIRTEAEEDRAGNADDSVSDMSNLPGDEPQHPKPAPAPAAQPALTAVSLPTRPPPRLMTLTSTGSFHVPKSMFNLLNDSPAAIASLVGSPFSRGSGSGVSTPMTKAQVAYMNALREEVLDGIGELKDEIASADEQIAAYAEAQILSSSTVLVYKPNSTVEKFLLAAAKKRKFSVLLAGFNNRKEVDDYNKTGFRDQLSKLKIESIVLAGNATAHIGRVNTVILNARGMASCGAVVVDAGAASIAKGACYAKRTVIVLGAVYKLCPQDVTDLAGLVDMNSAVLTEVILPSYIDIYITNL